MGVWSRVTCQSCTRRLVVSGRSQMKQLVLTVGGIAVVAVGGIALDWRFWPVLAVVVAVGVVSYLSFEFEVADKQAVEAS